MRVITKQALSLHPPCRLSGMMQPSPTQRTPNMDRPTLSATAPRQPPLWLAYACLALSMSLVGSYVALSKPLLLVFPVFLLAWLRFAIGALAMPHWFQPRSHEPPLNRRTQQLLFLESFLGNFLFTICMLMGMRRTSAVHAGVILAALPSVVALLSWLFLRERIGLRVGSAIVLAVLGISWFSLAEPLTTEQASTSHWLGNLLVFGAVVCEAAYAVIGKTLTASLSPRRITAIINLWGLVLMTPLGLYAAWHFEFGAVTPGLWLLLLFYGLAASVWTVWLWMTGLRSVPAARAGVFTVMLPMAAALVGMVFLGERLSTSQWLSFGVCLLGVVLATTPAKAPA
jgi:drug/metabolite transporter (DMT)-like permease